MVLNSRLWRLLASHSLALWLIGLLAAATMLGGTLPQAGRLSPEQRQGFQVEWGGISSWLETLQFSHVFGSWWFTALYALLIVNVGVGTVQSIIWRYRWYRGKTAPTLRFHDEGSFSAAHLRPLCSGFGFSPSSGSQIRGTLGLWGVPVLHAGILVIVLGGIWSAVQGFGAHLELSEGESYSGAQEKLAVDRGKGLPSGLGFTLRLDELEVQVSDSGHLRELWARLSYQTEGGRTGSSITEANRPLKLGIYELSPNNTGGYAAVFERLRSDGSRRLMYVHFDVPLTDWNWDGQWTVQRDVLVELDDAPLFYKMSLHGKEAPRLSMTVKKGIEVLFDGTLVPGGEADLGAYRLQFKGVVPWLGFYLTTDYPKYTVFAGFLVMLGGFLLHLLWWPRRIEVIQDGERWTLRAWVMPSDWRFFACWRERFSSGGDR